MPGVHSSVTLVEDLSYNHSLLLKIIFFRDRQVVTSRRWPILGMYPFWDLWFSSACEELKYWKIHSEQQKWSSKKCHISWWYLWRCPKTKRSCRHIQAINSKTQQVTRKVNTDIQKPIYRHTYQWVITGPEHTFVLCKHDLVNIVIFVFCVYIGNKNNNWVKMWTKWRTELQMFIY